MTASLHEITIKPREESELYKGAKIIIRYVPGNPEDKRWAYEAHIPRTQIIKGTAKDRGYALGTAKRCIDRCQR